MSNDNPKTDHLKVYQWQKGQSGNPEGGKRKYVSLLKAQGYTMSEVKDCILVMLSMTIEELQGVFENNNATALEKSIASAIRRDIQKGWLINIDSLMNRVFGTAKQTIDNNVNMRKPIIIDWTGGTEPDQTETQTKT